MLAAGCCWLLIADADAADPPLLSHQNGSEGLGYYLDPAAHLAPWGDEAAAAGAAAGSAGDGLGEGDGAAAVRELLASISASERRADTTD